MKVLDKRTTGDAVKLLIFIVVTTVATSLLVVTIGNVSFGDTKEYKAVFSDATGVVNGDDVRMAGVKVGNVEDVEIVDRTRALVTFKVDGRPPAHRQHVRLGPLPQPRRPALHRADPGRRRPVDPPGGRDDPADADRARARPDRAVQRLQAAVRGALARGRQQARLRDRHGLPGRGRHAREPARAHRLGHHHAGQPRPDHRRPDHQPQRGHGDARQPRHGAVRPADQAARVRLRALPGPRGDPRVARLGLGAGGARPPTW